MFRSKIFSRTISTCKSYNTTFSDKFQYLLKQNLDIDEIRKKHILKAPKHIQDIFNHESIVLDFFVNKRKSIPHLISARATKISEFTQKLVESDNNPLNLNYKFNSDTKIIKSTYGWSYHNTPQVLNQNSNIDQYFYLLKSSLIEGIFVDEISLMGFDLILLDLKKYDTSFSGWDILNSFEKIDEVNDKELKSLRSIVADKLLRYVVIYDVVCLE